jgi:hypothetical protein
MLGNQGREFSTVPKRGTRQEVDHENLEKKATYAYYLWPILRGIALIVALWAFVPFLFSLLQLYGAKTWPAGPVFVVASFALTLMHPKRLRSLEISPRWNSGTLPAFAGEGARKAKRHQLPWAILAHCFTTGLGSNWACVFLWFSRRYDFFSGPVIGTTVLMIAVYAAIALLVALLTGGNWRKGLAVFALEFALAIVVLRLGLLR